MTVLLGALDRQRQQGGVRDPKRDLFRWYSPDRSECRIEYYSGSPDDVDEVIAEEIALATRGAYALEWKVYTHDEPGNLPDRLLAQGFEAEPVELLMVLPIDEQAFDSFTSIEAYDVRRVDHLSELGAVAAISEDIGRNNVEKERAQLAWVLEHRPQDMSVFIAYVDGKPASCGRAYYSTGSPFVELCGGRTRVRNRNKGLYTALVAARLREAAARGCSYATVDALPTSEPILKKRGFAGISKVRAYCWEPSG